MMSSTRPLRPSRPCLQEVVPSVRCLQRVFLRAKPNDACEPHYLSLAATSSSLSLCAHMTSSTKQKYGNTYCIITPPEEDRATAIGNMHKNFGEDRTCSSEDMISDRQTRRHTYRETRSSQYSAPISGAE